MRVLGVDPGKMIGIALLDVYDNELLESDQIGFDVAPAKLQKLIRRADHVAVERFSIGSGRGGAAMSREYEVIYTIGGVIFLCNLHDVPCQLQSPSDAKTAFSNEILESIELAGMRVAGPHARDALRHALLAARTIQKKL